MKPRYFLASLLCLVALATTPSFAAEAPPDVQAAITQAARALNQGDLASLRAVTASDPNAVYRWHVPPGQSWLAIPVQRQWKVGALQIPGDPAAGWLAVFWRVHSVQSTSDHVHELVREGSAWKIGREIPVTDTLGFRPRDHRIIAHFDPANHGATFTDELLVKRTRPDARALQLRLSSEFTVDGIFDQGQPAPFIQVGGVVYVAPPQSQEFRLTLEYHGNLGDPGMPGGNIVDQKEVVLTGYWYPNIARLPTTNTVTAVVPRGWTAISQGNLIRRSEQGSSTHFTYHMDVPNCFFTLDAGPYHIYEKTSAGRRYRVCLLAPERERAEKQLELLHPSFQLFEKIWGPYPFDHYTIVETQQPAIGFLLESYTFTTYRRGFLPSPDPHEWGHTWWGGFVPCTYLQDIWNESFATYSTSVFYRHGNFGNPAACGQVFWQRSSPGLEQRTGSVCLAESASDGRAPVGTVGYTKGALVMQNLEETLGFDRLMKCMRVFREQHPRGEAATWADFERVVNRVSGEDHRWWFDQWVRRTGLPRLKWENVTLRRAGNRYVVSAELIQVGDVYRLKVPVWLTTESGDTVRRVCEVSEARTSVKLESRTLPRRLILDPELRLPRAVTPEEMPLTRRGGPAPRAPPARRIVVADDANRAEAERLGRFGPVSVKRDTDVREEDLQDADLTIIGSTDTNRLWARLAAHCPFQARVGAITFRGKTYPGATATAVAAHPTSPGRTITWLAQAGRTVAVPSAFGRVLVYDAEGRLLDAEVGIVRGGASVHEFPNQAGMGRARRPYSGDRAPAPHRRSNSARNTVTVGSSMRVKRMSRSALPG